MPFADEQPFLDAIFTRYHDDGPRLVYADFLEDAGDADRAELVRVQLALTRLPDDHPRRPELVNREAVLWSSTSARWTDHLRGLDVTAWSRRGVPDSVSMDAEAFLDAGEELFRRLHVRHLHLRDAGRVMAKLIHSPLLAAVRELDLCGNELGNGGVNLLARSPHLKALDTLDLGFNGVDDAGVSALAQSSGLPNLTSLSINDNGQVTAEGVRGLAESPFFAGLVELDLSGNDVADLGVRALVSGKAFPRLRALRIKGNHIGDAGAALLARSPLLARMLAHSPRLELRENAIGPEGVAALVASPALRRCAALDLGGNYLGDRGFVAVVASAQLGGVHTLRLAGNQITDSGAVAARAALPALLARLRVLDLSGNRMTKYGIGLFHAARGESGVVLEVGGNVQTSSGVETPVTVGQVVNGVLQGVAEAAALRRRISHPRTLPGDHPG